MLHGKVPVIEEAQTHDDLEKWVPMTDLRVAEREQEPTLPVTVGTGAEAKRVKLPVAATLNTVESEAARKAAGPEAEPRMQLFISYAHLNETELIPFRPHLTHLSQQGYIQVWNDRDLVPGEQWEAGITDALHRADIVLLFYTTTALARSDAKQCTMLWVPLERNDLDAKHPLEQRLNKLQCATRDARPVYDFEIVQKGWMEVEQAIRRAVEARRKLVR